MGPNSESISWELTIFIQTYNTVLTSTEGSFAIDREGRAGLNDVVSGGAVGHMV